MDAWTTTITNTTPGYPTRRSIDPDVCRIPVQTNNFSAEYGRAGGAIVNVSLKSGTNAFHGAAWDFLRNTSLNAVGYFKPALGKPVFQQNQFGGAFGGRIVRNKTFFFADYEGTRRATRTLSYLTIPTADQRNGIFDRPIKNPYTGGDLPPTADSEIAHHPLRRERLSANWWLPQIGHRKNYQAAAPHSHRDNGRHPHRPLFQQQGDCVRAIQPPMRSRKPTRR